MPAGRFFPEAISSGRQFAALDRMLEKTRTGPFHLQRPGIADIVVAAIAYNASTLSHYELHAFVVMPNHVHLLLTPAIPLPK